MKEDGKRCETSVTISLLAKNSLKRHLPLNSSFCKRPEVSHTQALCRLLLSAVLLRKLTIISASLGTDQGWERTGLTRCPSYPYPKPVRQ